MFLVYNSADCSAKIPSTNYSQALNLFSSSLQSLYEEEDSGLIEQHSDLKHSPNIILNPKKYKKLSFNKKLQQLLCEDLTVDGWVDKDIDPSDIKIKRITGALTNSVFFVSYDGAPTVLLRVYGPSSTLLISRPREMHILNTLSRHYNLGPKIYGTFANGRVEEWFSSRPCSKDDIRSDLKIDIAKRMRELHQVDLKKMNVVGPVAPGYNERSTSYGVWDNISSWLTPASVVLKRLSRVKFPESHNYYNLVESINLPLLIQEFNAYEDFLREYEEINGASPLVFCHNDTQPGNILLLDRRPVDKPSHHKICVIDFEYAAPNARGYDIANHFTEWRYDYHHETLSWKPLLSYPSEEDRRRFYDAYVVDSEKQQPGWFERLEMERKTWSPASLAMWGIWAIVQSRDQVKAMGSKFGTTVSSLHTSAGADMAVNLEERTSAVVLDDSSSDEEAPAQEGGDDFEYLLYAKAKIDAFREEYYNLKEECPLKRPSN
ncbi:kinase-like protein [Wallemia mellicola]|uniref:Kinase-like protein n=1 Tax=Wallemia mellicola TaxID=1708541 RepID=A0A4T0MGQ4_9BASI|nr:kinase-like protein [Wallemia mellicola]